MFFGSFFELFIVFLQAFFCFQQPSLFLRNLMISTTFPRNFPLNSFCLRRNLNLSSTSTDQTFSPVGFTWNKTKKTQEVNNFLSLKINIASDKHKQNFQSRLISQTFLQSKKKTHFRSKSKESFIISSIRSIKFVFKHESSRHWPTNILFSHLVLFPFDYFPLPSKTGLSCWCIQRCRNAWGKFFSFSAQ